MSPPYPVELLTLFPGMVSGYLGASILGKAQEKGLLSATVTDIREYAEGKHRVTDDAPYGGGAGMVMKPEPLVAAISAARARLPGAKVLLMSPRGATFTQVTARELVAHTAGLILVCGRYEGVDERVMSHLDGELSLGDFVLTGGEIAAMAVVDAVARLVPGVLGNVASSVSESFEEGTLEHPQYTRPPVFQGVEVPAALQSGDHARIARWRRWKSLVLTRERRPDLFARLTLSKADEKLLARREEEL
ncbi:tRNA (guanosine(37)-N1)-methyltransferase TrmD [Myxococcus faecalis]|uniref:tRNA (guanosine(37)-N1)-methyltransferase TrmD n=1 Tax=Myxococcus TaxID=32 RepID=UPI001CBEB2AF|nr:tRNA (guanosine(37)-N1)-methyltransferase TrmD [Myxococcus sp. AS-1-15]MBZ4409307.1 tRNA (guanosine(37)-N1)-methyltransferase TrmD [Myxococcus sp. XM-1-1-1]MCK8499567.1 tRNA (guanosine(37)-N1)-methyltransferase TrmD [Myxococcus fulvus]BDT34917.1 tRNA (guanosine(37)-N1)-methyltransferase TrmD [Myxococcus sp. MH1]